MHHPTLTIKPISSHLQDLQDFSQTFAWHPAWPKDLVRRFLTELTSSPDLVLDVWDDQKRVALAVVVDQVSNRGNFGGLEILGMLPDQDIEAVYDAIIAAAQARLPRGKSGIELGIADSIALPERFIADRGFSPYYTSYEMLHRDLASVDGSRDPSVSPIRDDEEREVYDVIVESTRENPDISVPSWEAWQMSRAQARASELLLLREDRQVVGFASLADTATQRPELRTLGLLPAWRGRGLGKLLLSQALIHLRDQGAERCALTVSVQNVQALSLYQSQGFAIVSHARVFCWTRP